MDWKEVRSNVGYFIFRVVFFPLDVMNWILQFALTGEINQKKALEERVRKSLEEDKAWRAEYEAMTPEEKAALNLVEWCGPYRTKR